MARFFSVISDSDFFNVSDKMSSKGKGKRSTAITNGDSNGHHHHKRVKNGSIQFEFSDNLQNQQDKLAQALKSPNDQNFQDIHLIRDPFQVCVIDNVISNAGETFNDLIQELKDVEMCDKNNDLYKFKQSVQDLKHLENSPFVSGLKEFLQTKVKTWLEHVTGIQLDEEIDLFCAKYSYTDHLLCHDDELEGRRIAFIMYFVKDWTDKDGGTLDLFNRDESGHPSSIVQRLVPKTNSMAFFEVTEKSFHQVSEVLTKDKCRLSIGGWFHGSPYVRPQKISKAEPEPLEPQEIDEDDFYSWINPMYLDLEIQTEISARFEDSSEISLPSFLSDEKFKSVCEALEKCSSWQSCGPADQRHYEHLKEPSEILQNLKNFLTSDALVLMLSNMTGLKLHALAPDNGDDEDDDKDDNTDENSDDNEATPSTSNTKDPGAKTKTSVPKCQAEIRRWKQGCYTLLNDAKSNNDKFFLDGRLFFNCQDWNLEYGGFTSYIAKDEDEELLTATPEDNTFQLIYKDAQTLGFVKYVNDGINSMHNGEFHDISVNYFE